MIKRSILLKILKYYDGYQKGLASIFYNFFDKATAIGAVKDETIQNKELVEELYKAIFRKFEKPKAQLSFKDNICGADLADMELISKFN